MNECYWYRSLKCQQEAECINILFLEMYLSSLKSSGLRIHDMTLYMISMVQMSFVPLKITNN